MRFLPFSSLAWEYFGYVVFAEFWYPIWNGGKEGQMIEISRLASFA